MRKAWQNFKFFFGFLFFSTLFAYGIYWGFLYARDYIHEQSEQNTALADKEPAEPSFQEHMDQWDAKRERQQKEIEKKRQELSRLREEILTQADESAKEDTFTGGDIIPDPVPDEPEPKIPDTPKIPEPPIVPDTPKEEPKEPEPPIIDPGPPMPPVKTAASKRIPKELPEAMVYFKVKKGDPVFIRIIKDRKELELWMQPKGKSQYACVKTYPILGMSGVLGPKIKKGDLQAPEGFYTSYASSLNPNSNFHLSFNVEYPNAWDKMQNRTGSHIMVHGSNVSVGCFAMGDPGIEEIYGLVEAFVKGRQGKAGVPIQVYPFEPNMLRMMRERNSPHYPFWCFLCEAWCWTEKNKTPAPVVFRERSLYLEEAELNVDESGKYTYVSGQFIRNKREAEERKAQMSSTEKKQDPEAPVKI